MVAHWVQTKTAEVQRQLRRRLRREAGYYLPSLAAVFVVAGAPTPANVVFWIGIVAVLGMLVATLWWSERRLAAAPLDRGLRDALAALRRDVDAASHTYLIAFVAAFVALTILSAGMVWWRHGVDWRLPAIAAGGAAAIIWSYWSGRAYVRRMFGPYQMLLADCLRQLDDPS